MENIQISEALIEAARNVKRVSGLTHDFYKYPARFSPSFVREAIQAFTQPGDTILDPFAGGGTTLVEAHAAGRNAIGTDINSLACFVSKVKTSRLTKKDISAVRQAVEQITEAPLPSWIREEVVDSHYKHHMEAVGTWRLRHFFEFVVASSNTLPPRGRDFIRVVALRTGQWALDNRKVIPNLAEARIKFRLNASSMLDGMRAYTEAVAAGRNVDINKPKAINRSVIGIEQDRRFIGVTPQLVLTSPPYPGVHLLYHRWQIKGRRETAFPYWLASSLDGQTASYYNLGSRHEAGLKTYFAGIQESFKSIAALCNHETLVVQMLAFSEPDWQLPEYLQTMKAAGFQEAVQADARIWREVPNRKWYTNVTTSENTKMEVVLFHRLSPHPLTPPN